MPRWFADAAAVVAGFVSMLVVSLGTNPAGVGLAAVLFVASVLWVARPRDPEGDRP